MINLSHILEGWSNYMDKSEVVQAIAEERAAVCASCPFAKRGKLLTFVKDTLTEVQGLYCDKCGCPLSAKIRSSDVCPLQKWNE